MKDLFAGRSPWVFVGAVLLLAVAGLLTWLLVGARVDNGNAFWFVGLLVLFTAAITLTAMVYNGLGISTQDEAFGLPPGSIRTLLAIGIMVLFTVFGLRFFEQTGAVEKTTRVGDKPFETVQISPDKLDAEVKRYQELDVAAIPTSPGRAASGNDPGRPAEVKLYLYKAQRPADAVDMQKQILTAIITLLTTVIGFYFGTRSATEGSKTASAGEPPVISSAKADRQTLHEGLTALQADLNQQRAHLAALSAATPQADSGQAAHRATALSSADNAAQQLEQHLAALKEAINAVDAGLMALSSAAASDRVTAEAQLRTAFGSARVKQSDAQAAAATLQRLMQDADRLWAQG